MNIISTVFNLILYQPLFNILILLYLYVPGHDFGVAIIILTLLIRFLLYPLMGQSIRSQKVLNELQPKIQEIQKQYRDDKQKQNRAMMELYQKEKFNPLGGCLPLLLQFPILIALYQVFSRVFKTEEMTYLYSFVRSPGQIKATFLGLINLAQSCTIKIDNITHYVWPGIILVLLAGITQFIQTKTMTPAAPKNAPKVSDKNAQLSQMMQKQTMYLFPLFTVFILWNFPSAIALYWTVSNIFSIVQQKLIFKKINYAQPK